MHNRTVYSLRPVATAALALALAATGARAAERYAYRFSPGKPLKYRTVLLSEGAFTLPDGSPKTLKLEAVSVLQLTPEASTPEGFRLTAETLHARTLLDGREAPPPKADQAKRTLTVKPDGSIAGGGDHTFEIVFPDRPLARGDSFQAERTPPAGAPGLPLKTTYTVADPAASLAGYPAPVALIEARAELAGRPSGRKLTLKEGGGRFWFDPAAGVLVKAHLAYVFREDTPLPGATGGSTRVTSVTYDSELVR